MGENKITKYPGKEIDVSWDERLCIHVTECGKAKGDLFVAGRETWCQPDMATCGEVREVVERCPTGALTYDDKLGGVETAEEHSTVTVACNGPLLTRGELRIEGAPDDMPGVRFRAALCRCGASKNKPFCDGSHEEAGFSDYGAIGDRGEDTGERGGELVIKPLKDGPLMFSGNLTLIACGGRVAWFGNRVALCRCGASENKPFCDGSHKTIGFKAE